MVEYFLRIDSSHNEPVVMATVLILSVIHQGWDDTDKIYSSGSYYKNTVKPAIYGLEDHLSCKATFYELNLSCNSIDLMFIFPFFCKGTCLLQPIFIENFSSRSKVLLNIIKVKQIRMFLVQFVILQIFLHLYGLFTPSESETERNFFSLKYQ